MRGPSLQKTTLLSFCLHLTAFLIVILLVRQSNKPFIPSPYIVNLVSSEILTKADNNKTEAFETSEDSVKMTVSKKDITKLSKNKEENVREREMIEEKVSVIAAKKKIEKLVKLRSIIDLKARGNKNTGKTQTASTSHSLSEGKGTMFDAYYSKIHDEIWQQWVYPDTGKKDLEAIISIRILKDGTTIVQRIEKSSGNSLFDRSAIKAITKANPLPQPPYEMEIGVRFHP
jgi:colicin import membrane protein